MFSHRRLKGLLARFLISGASVVLTLGVLELVGRLFLVPLVVRYSDNEALKLQLANPKDLGVASLYVPHHYYLYTTRPSYRSADGKIRHNAVGCRAEEVKSPKPSNVYRIVAVGGSTTYSTRVHSNDRIYTYTLEKLLKDWAFKNGIMLSFEVLNCGVPGFTSAENLARYIFALSEYSPNLLIVQQGINDVYPRSLPQLSRDYSEFSKSWEGFDPRKKKWFISKVIDAARNRFSDSVWTQGINYLVRHPFWKEKASGVNPVNFEKNPPLVFEANTRYLIRVAQGDGATPLVMTEHLVIDPNDRPHDWLPKGGIEAVLEHNRVVQKIAAQEGTYFLNVQSALCACGSIMPDGRHLNEEGEAGKAQAIFEYLKKEFSEGKWLKSWRAPDHMSLKSR